jgi:hypothetical protein
MSKSKMRLLALGVAAVGAIATGGYYLASAGQAGGQRLEAAEATAPAKPAAKDDGSVRVDAPDTAVSVDRERGKVSVTAPYTDVKVDPDKGRVQVRAPYVDLDIRW